MAQKHVKKSAQKAQPKNATLMRTTVYFGYGLFLLMVVSFFISISPWFRLFGAPAPHPVNITIILITVAISTFAPLVVGYMVGDKATRKRPALLHHYNGVLFGVAGLWLGLTLSTLLVYLEGFSFFAYTSLVTYKIVQFIPVILTVVALALLGAFYAKRTRHQVALIDYAPYRHVLIWSVLAMACIGVAATLASIPFSSPSSIGMTLFIAGVTPLTLLVTTATIGYIVVGKKAGTPFERILHSLVALSFGVVTTTVIGYLAMLIPNWRQEYILFALPIVVAVWGSYLVAVRRSTR